MKGQTANIIIMTHKSPWPTPLFYQIALPQGDDPLGSDRQPIDMKPSTDHLMQSMAIGYPGPRTKMDGNNQKDDHVLLVFLKYNGHIIKPFHLLWNDIMEKIQFDWIPRVSIRIQEELEFDPRHCLVIIAPPWLLTSLLVLPFSPLHLKSGFR